MLRLFRNLRQLELRQRSGRYFIYAFGEIVLIVVGILLALQISEWNQERKDRAEETGILIQLKADFEQNQKLLLQGEGYLTRNISELVSFLAIMDPLPDTYPDELIHSYILALRSVFEYIPNTSVIDSVMASGKMSLIKNEDLSRRLSRWLRNMETYQATVNIMLEEDLIVWEFISDHHQHRDIRIGKREERDTGPSKFAYDQSKLLSNPKLENFVEEKRIYTNDTLDRLGNLQTLQQSILDLIDEELAKRGVTTD